MDAAYLEQTYEASSFFMAEPDYFTVPKVFPFSQIDRKMCPDSSRIESIQRSKAAAAGNIPFFIQMF
jgi:hypothetical protein